MNWELDDMNTDKKKTGWLIIACVLAAVLAVSGFMAWRFFPYKDKKIPVKVLILPKFEVDGI